MRSLWFALLLSACGASAPGNAWQTHTPVRLFVNELVPVNRAAVAESLSAGLGQFGFATTTMGWGQQLAVSYDAACRCRTCTTGQTQHLDTTAAYVSQADYRTIYVCPAMANVVRDFGERAAIDMVIKHELGHSLGLVEHAEPAPGVLMSARVESRPTVRTFGPTDIARICAAGGVHGSVCN